MRRVSDPVLLPQTPFSQQQQQQQQHANNIALLQRGSTPPPQLVLDDPQRGPLFLFHVAASHGAPLRAAQVFITKELFFRFFIESGVACAVSSFASRKQQQQQLQQQQLQTKKGGGSGSSERVGTAEATSKESQLAALKEKKKFLLASRSLSMRSGTIGGGGGGGTESLMNGGMGSGGQDDAGGDELDDDIQTRLPSCWSTPPVSFALLYRLWNENCSKEYVDTMLFEGFENALNQMIERAQGIYDAHFRREQELRRSMSKAAESERLTFRLGVGVGMMMAGGGSGSADGVGGGGGGATAVKKSLLAPILPTMGASARQTMSAAFSRGLSRRMSGETSAAAASSNDININNNNNNAAAALSSSMRAAPRVVTIQEHGEDGGESKTQTQEQEEILSETSDASPSTAVAENTRAQQQQQQQESQRASSFQFPASDNGNEDYDHDNNNSNEAAAATAASGEIIDSGDAMVPQDEQQQQQQQQQHFTADEPQPSPTGGREHLSSMLEAFCASCCHDTVTSILTVQSLHNGSSGLSDTTVEVLLAAFAKHSALLRFLFRTGVHMSHLKAVREKEQARAEEEKRRSSISLQQQQQQFAAASSSAVGSGLISVGSFAPLGAFGSSLPHILPSGSSVPPLSPTTLSAGQQQPQRRRASVTASPGLGPTPPPGGKATAATELLAATIFDIVCKDEKVRNEFMERVSDDCHNNNNNNNNHRNRHNNNNNFASVFAPAATSSLSGTTTASFDNISTETIVWLLSTAGAAEYSTHSMFLPERGYTDLLRLLRIYPQLLTAEMVECFLLSMSHEDTRELERQNATPIGDLGGVSGGGVGGGVTLGTAAANQPVSFLAQQLEAAEQQRMSTPPALLGTPRGTPEPGSLRPEACFEFDEFVDFIFSLAVAIFGDRGAFDRHVTVQAAVLSMLSLLEACTVRYIIAPLAQFSSHLSQLIARSNEANRKVQEFHRQQQREKESEREREREQQRAMLTREESASAAPLCATQSIFTEEVPVSPQHPRRLDETRQQRQEQQQQQQQSPPQEIKLRRSHFAVLQSLAQQSIDNSTGMTNNDHKNIVAASDATDTLAEMLTYDVSILCSRMTPAALGAGASTIMLSSAEAQHHLLHPHLGATMTSMMAASHAHVGPNFFGTINNLQNFHNNNNTMLLGAAASPNDTVALNHRRAIRDHQMIRREQDEQEMDGSVGRFNVSGFNKKRIVINSNFEPTVRDFALPSFAVTARGNNNNHINNNANSTQNPTSSIEERQLVFGFTINNHGGGGCADTALASTMVKNMMLVRSFGMGVVGAAGSLADAGAQFMSGLQMKNTEYELEQQDALGCTRAANTLRDVRLHQPGALKPLPPPAREHQHRLDFSTTATMAARNNRLQLLQQDLSSTTAGGDAGSNRNVSRDATAGADTGPNASTRWRTLTTFQHIFEQGDDVPVLKTFSHGGASSTSNNNASNNNTSGRPSTRESAAGVGGNLSNRASRPNTASMGMTMQQHTSTFDGPPHQQQQQQQQQHQQNAAQTVADMVDSMLVPEIWAVLPKVVRLTASEPHVSKRKESKNSAGPVSAASGGASRSSSRAHGGGGYSLPAAWSPVPGSASFSFANRRPSVVQLQQQQRSTPQYRDNTNLFISCWNMDAEPPPVSITSAMDDLSSRREREAQAERARQLHLQAQAERTRQLREAAEAEKKRQQQQQSGGGGGGAGDAALADFDEMVSMRKNGGAKSQGAASSNSNMAMAAAAAAAAIATAASSTKTTTIGGQSGVATTATTATATTTTPAANLKAGLNLPSAATVAAASAISAKNALIVHRSEYGSTYTVDERGIPSTSHFTNTSSAPTLQAILHFRLLVRTFKIKKDAFSNSEEKDRWCQLLRNIGNRVTQELFGRFDPRFVMEQCLAKGIEGLQSFVKAQCNPLMFHSEDELIEMNFKSAVQKSRTSILIFGLRPGTNVRDPGVKPLAVSALATRRNRLYCANLAAHRVRQSFRGSALVNVVVSPRPNKAMLAVNSKGRDFVAGPEDRGLEDLPPRAVEFLQSLFLQCSWVYRLDVAGGKSVSDEENSWLGPPQHCIAVEVPPSKPAVVKPPAAAAAAAVGSAALASAAASARSKLQAAAASSFSSSIVAGAENSVNPSQQPPQQQQQQPLPQQLSLPWNSDSTMTMPASIGLKRALFHFFSRWGTKRRPTPPEPAPSLVINMEDSTTACAAAAAASSSTTSPQAARRSRRGRGGGGRDRSASPGDALSAPPGGAGRASSSSRGPSPNSTMTGPRSPRSLGSTMVGDASVRSTSTSGGGGGGGSTKKRKKKQDDVQPRVVVPSRAAKLDEAPFHFFISRSNFIKWAEAAFGNGKNQQQPVQVQHQNDGPNSAAERTTIELSELALVKFRHVDKFCGSVDPESILRATSRVSLLHMFDFFAAGCGTTEKDLAMFDISREAQKLAAGSITAQCFAWDGPFFVLEDGAKVALPGPLEIRVPPISPDDPLYSLCQTHLQQQQQQQQSQRRRSVVMSPTNVMMMMNSERDNILSPPSFITSPRFGTTNNNGSNNNNVSFVDITGAAASAAPPPPALQSTTVRDAVLASSSINARSASASSASSQDVGLGGASSSRRTAVPAAASSSSRRLSAREPPAPKLTKKQLREQKKGEAEQMRQQEQAERQRAQEEQQRLDDIAFRKKYNIDDADDTERGLSAHAFLSLLGILAAQLPNQTGEQDDVGDREQQRRQREEEADESALLGNAAASHLSPTSKFAATARNHDHISSTKSDPLELASPKAKRSDNGKPSHRQHHHHHHHHPRQQQEQQPRNEKTKSDSSSSSFPQLPNVQVVNQRLQALLERDIDPARGYKRRYYKKAAEIDLNLAADVPSLLPRKFFKPKPPAPAAAGAGLSVSPSSPASAASSASLAASARTQHILSKRRHRHNYPAVNYSHRSLYKSKFPEIVQRTRAERQADGGGDDDADDGHRRSDDDGHHDDQTYHRNDSPTSSSASSCGRGNGRDDDCDNDSNSSFGSSASEEEEKYANGERLRREVRKVDARDPRAHDRAFDETYLAQHRSAPVAQVGSILELRAKRQAFDLKQTQLLRTLDPEGRDSSVPHASLRTRIAHRAMLATKLAAATSSSQNSSAAPSRLATPQRGATRQVSSQRRQGQQQQQQQQQQVSSAALLDIDAIDENHPVFSSQLQQFLREEQHQQQHSNTDNRNEGGIIRDGESGKNNNTPTVSSNSYFPPSSSSLLLAEDPKWRDEGRVPQLEPVHRLCRGRYGARALIAEAIDDTAEIRPSVFLSAQQKELQRNESSSQSIAEQMGEAVRISTVHEELSGCIMPESPRMREMKRQQQHLHSVALWGQGLTKMQQQQLQQQQQQQRKQSGSKQSRSGSVSVGPSGRTSNNNNNNPNTSSRK